jgi:hypothetical protein
MIFFTQCADLPTVGMVYRSLFFLFHEAAGYFYAFGVGGVGVDHVG